MSETSICRSDAFVLPNQGEGGPAARQGIPGLSFHHLGLAVQRPAEAFAYLHALGYQVGRQVFDPLQRVNLALRHHPVMPDVEVIWPDAGPSPIDKIIARNGPGVYHTCYEATDLDRVVGQLETFGLNVQPVSLPTPALLFDGREVSFYTVGGFGLIELLHAG